MAKPKDRVKLRKNESAATGGDPLDEDAGFPTLLDPFEDGPMMQGAFLQPPRITPGVDPPMDEEVYYGRDELGNMLFRDVFNPVELTLTQLALGGGGAPDLDAALIDDVVATAMVDDVTGNILVDA